MFGSFLVDQGVEMEVKAELGQVVKILDRQVPAFAYQGYRFRLNITKGVLGSEWRFVVNPVEGKTGRALDTPMGLVILAQREDGTTAFRIPPRSQWATPESAAFDPEGRFFTSFVFQVMEAFQRLGWIELPGPLPQVQPERDDR